jgi:hypothetical protein
LQNGITLTAFKNEYNYQKEQTAKLEDAKKD